MNFTYIYAIGAAQGLILAIALWTKQVNKRSNQVLSVWMLLLVMDLIMKVCYLNDQNTAFLPGYVLVTFFPFLYGSFFYLYIRTIVSKSKIKWQDVIHFFGFLFMAGANIPWIVNPWDNGPRAFGYFDLSLYLYSVSYVVASLLTIRRYRKTLEQQQSNTDGIALVWIDVMAYFQALIWFVAVSQWLMSIKSYDVWVIYLTVAIWMTVMGYLALLQQNIKPLKKIAVPAHVEDERFPEVDTKLKRLMEHENLYLDATLNIGQLAKKSGYPEYLVSLVINRKYQQSFREYINYYRIHAAEKKLKDPDDNASILDIAYDCGFTSKSTFNSAFKKTNQQTPSQFRQKYL